MAKKKTGLMKKYIKLAGGDFKKAWKLQKAAARKRSPSKKRKPAKKRKSVKKRNPVKAAAAKNPVNPKPKRKVVKMAKRGRKGKRKRYRRNPGNPGKMQDVLAQGAAAVGGAIAAGVVANMIPLPDPRLKAVLPIIGAVILAGTKFGRGKMMVGVVTGMAAAGGLSLVRQLAPNIPLLAGEEETLLDYVPPTEEEEALMLGQDLDEEVDEDLLGQDLDEEMEEGELTGDSLELGEEGEFYTPADI